MSFLGEKQQAGERGLGHRKSCSSKCRKSAIMSTMEKQSYCQTLMCRTNLQRQKASWHQWTWLLGAKFNISYKEGVTEFFLLRDKGHLSCHWQQKEQEGQALQWTRFGASLETVCCKPGASCLLAFVDKPLLAACAHTQEKDAYKTQAEVSISKLCKTWQTVIGLVTSLLPAHTLPQAQPRRFRRCLLNSHVSSLLSDQIFRTEKTLIVT